MDFKRRRKTEIISTIIAFVLMVLMHKFLLKKEEYLLIPAVWAITWLAAKFIEIALFEICNKNKTIIIANIVLIPIISASSILISKFLLNIQEADEIFINVTAAYILSTLLEYLDLRKEKLKLEKK